VVDGAEGQVELQREVEVVTPERFRYRIDVEGLGEQILQRTLQIRRPAAELLQRALERLQVGVEVAARRPQILVDGLAQPAHRVDSVDQKLFLLREMMD